VVLGQNPDDPLRRGRGTVVVDVLDAGEPSGDLLQAPDLIRTVLERDGERVRVDEQDGFELVELQVCDEPMIPDVRLERVLEGEDVGSRVGRVTDVAAFPGKSAGRA